MVRNSEFIANEVSWFQQLMMLRAKITFENSIPEESLKELLPPDIDGQSCSYTQLISKHQMGFEERVVLVLALIPHVLPSALDVLNMKNELYGIPFTEFGGIRLGQHRAILPTVETAIFLLAGTDIKRRQEFLSLFKKDHFFHKEGILRLERSELSDPVLHDVLTLSPAYAGLLTNFKDSDPELSLQFPVKRISTELNWEDLVLSDHLIDSIEEIKNYLTCGRQLKKEYQFGRKIKPGFKVLFTGPSGTGKTSTAGLIGKSCNMDVYRVNLSMVVSKYIGETEKNLSQIFNLAENKDWILFFDEADALFGKRTSVKDAHDRYANQEVSYFLRRIEDFDGLVILF